MNADAEAAGLDRRRLRRLDDYFLRHHIDEGHIAGCQILLARHGHVAHRSSLGLMDVERARPVADDTIWRWASQTKPITGVALMTLYEQGLFQLTDPIDRYLPEWRDIEVGVTRPDGGLELVAPDRAITVRDAMMHMTGIGEGPRDDYVNDREKFTGSVTLAELSTLLAKEPLRFHPGRHWHYSWSTDICARLVEAISGSRFSEYLEREVCEPLGMVDTGFFVPVQKEHRVPAVYARGAADTWTYGDRRPDDAVGLRLVSHPGADGLGDPPAFESGGGGLVGTIDDYARFAQMLLDGGDVDGHRVLARPTRELMSWNHLPDGREIPDFALPGEYGEKLDGLGFGLTVAIRLDSASSSGVGPSGSFHWGGAFGTSFWVDPAEDLFAMFMTQLSGGNTMFAFREELRSLAYAAILD